MQSCPVDFIWYCPSKRTTQQWNLHWYQADFICHYPSKVPTQQRAGIEIYQRTPPNVHIKELIHVWSALILDWLYMVLPFQRNGSQRRYRYTSHRDNQRTPKGVSLDKSKWSALTSGHTYMEFAPERTGSTASRYSYTRRYWATRV